ncbi:S-adenosyl-L-methionine-dependent tRNA 4-demethylwyosine synthase TYW1-like isoform X2 [Patagioenas fasciata]|uniref:S-adenosyl-L-methionine-dependent tRNA 4-demethylwyosine synthase TYW1-like isoform X1 n=1 Tax=Patagioenas fasciata TaxID=372321 RepID=UPI003A9A3819
MGLRLAQQRFARGLAEAVISLCLPVEVISMGDYDPEETTGRNVCVFLVATYTDGQPTESAAWFCKGLEEAARDFRFGKTYLKGLRYAVFGLGNAVYVDHYNTLEDHKGAEEPVILPDWFLVTLAIFALLLAPFALNRV